MQTKDFFVDCITFTRDVGAILSKVKILLGLAASLNSLEVFIHLDE